MAHANNFGQGDGTLGRAAAMVTQAKADFLTTSTQLSGRIQGMQSQFQGQGGSSFFLLHQAWTERQRTIVEALDRFAESLVATERDNLATDEAQSTVMRSLAGRLG